MKTNNNTDIRIFHISKAIIDELKRKTGIINEGILVLKAIEVLCSIVFHKGDKNIYLVSDKHIGKYKIEEMYDIAYGLQFPNKKTKEIKIDFSPMNQKDERLIAFVMDYISEENKKKITGNQFVNLAITVLLHFVKFIKEEKFEIYLSSKEIEQNKGKTWTKGLKKLELRETLQFT